MFLIPDILFFFWDSEQKRNKIKPWFSFHGEEGKWDAGLASVELSADADAPNTNFIVQRGGGSWRVSHFSHLFTHFSNFPKMHIYAHFFDFFCSFFLFFSAHFFVHSFSIYPILRIFDLFFQFLPFFFAIFDFF